MAGGLVSLWREGQESLSKEGPPSGRPLRRGSWVCISHSTGDRPSQGNGTCKGPEAGVGVFGEKVEAWRKGDRMVERVGRGHIPQALVSPTKGRGFDLRVWPFEAREPPESDCGVH